MAAINGATLPGVFSSRLKKEKAGPIITHLSGSATRILSPVSNRILPHRLHHLVERSSVQLVLAHVDEPDSAAAIHDKRRWLGEVNRVERQRIVHTVGLGYGTVLIKQKRK